MVNNIINGIVIKLKEIFGDDSVVYIEEVDQEFQGPCFYVKLLKGKQNITLNKRYHLEHFFQVQYYPGTTDKNNEMYEITSQIGELEYITIDDELSRGTEISYEIVNNRLNFNIQYDCFAYLAKDEVEKMHDISLQNQIGALI